MAEGDKIYIIQTNYKLVVKNKRWTIKDACEYITDYYVKDERYKTTEIANKKYQLMFDDILKIVRTSIDTSYLDINKVYDHEYDDEGRGCEVLSLSLSTISPASFIVWAMMHDLPVPEEFKEILPYYKKALANADNKEIPNATDVQKKIEGVNVTDTAIATELGTLRNEKLKWDLSIKAAAEIGLLFFEGGLTKPTTKDAFVAEFNSKIGGLPDTTVEKIYKALPSEYRHKGGKPKIAKTETAAITGIGDLNTALKAAVYAGSLFESRDAKDVNRLTKMLKENNYQVPPAAVIEKIVECVKDI